jgi:Skp family chaperone for outer membrane proteins
MKSIRFGGAVFVFALVFAVSAWGQPPVQPAGPIKVMFINTDAFRATGGITRYVNAVTALNKEFEVQRNEIRTMLTRHDALAKEVTQLQTQINAAPNAPTTPALIKQAETKIDEGRALETEIKRKQEDGKNKYERREIEMLDPVRNDIANALQDFGKQKGYHVILDASKIAAAILVYDVAKADVTKEFITFFNARPATAATKP